MINKDRTFFQYNSRDLVYIISLPTSQLCTASWKPTIRYVGPVVIYKIIDLHNYLLMTLDGRILRGLFEYDSFEHVGIGFDPKLCLCAWLFGRAQFKPWGVKKDSVPYITDIVLTNVLV